MSGRPILYDKIIQVDLFRNYDVTRTLTLENSEVMQASEVSSYTDSLDDAEALTATTTYLGNMARVDTTYDYNYNESTSDKISIQCKDMQLKPHIEVSFNLIQGAVTYGVVVKILNLNHLVNIYEYSTMDIILGYRMNTIGGGIKLTGATVDETEAVMRIQSPILRAYQASPNPDGETVFEGVITGKLLNELADYPVFLDIHSIEETIPNETVGTVQSEDGTTEDIKAANKTTKCCYVGLLTYLSMVGCSLSRGKIKYAPDKAGTSDENGNQAPLYDDTEVVRVVEDYDVEWTLPDYIMKGDYPDVSVPDGQEPFLLNIESLSGKANTNFFALIKTSEGEIARQLKQKYNISASLVIFNNTIILVTTGGDIVYDEASKKHLLSNVIPLTNFYSISYQGPILTITTPFDPRVKPGKIIRAFPNYYNGQGVVNSMNDIREDAEMSGNYLYTVIKMTVDFGTYENNTMTLLGIPINLSQSEADAKQNVVLPYNKQLETTKEDYGEDELMTLVFGEDPNADQINKDMTSLYVSDLNKYNLMLYQVQPPDSLSRIDKEVLRWKRYLWRASEFANTDRKTNENDTAGAAFKYVGEIINNEDFTEGVGYISKIYTINGSTSITIPVSEFWPLIIAICNTAWEHDIEKVRGHDLGYDRTRLDPDTLIRYNWLILPNLGIDSGKSDSDNEDSINDTLNSTEPSNKDIYLVCAVYAWYKFVHGAGTYTNNDIKNLMNIYIFLGGSLKEISEKIEEYKEEQENG